MGVAEGNELNQHASAKLPKGEAKGSIVPVRFSPEELKWVKASAKSTNQTVSSASGARSMLGRITEKANFELGHYRVCCLVGVGAAGTLDRGQATVARH